MRDVHLPPPPQGTRAHVLNGLTCWCQPTAVELWAEGDSEFAKRMITHHAPSEEQRHEGVSSERAAQEPVRPA